MGLYDNEEAVKDNANRAMPYHEPKSESIASAHPAEPNGEVEAEHYRLKRSIERLNDRLVVLKKRLHPVRAEYGFADGGKDEPNYASACSPLARSLQQDVNSVDELTNMVTSLLEELTLP